MDIVYVRGGDKLAPKVAKMSGMAYGTRHDYVSYGDVYMLDIHWTDYDWADYLAIIAQHKPTLAMVADYEYPSQRELMLQQIEDLRALGVPRIMCCPKFDGAVTDIPDDCIVAVSITTGYAGFMPQAAEVAGRKLHLLGGHPDQQARAIELYANATVVSVDGNVLAFKAGHGQYWHESGRWQAAPRKLYSTEELMIMSAKNIVAYLHSTAPKVYRSKRVTKMLTRSMF